MMAHQQNDAGVVLQQVCTSMSPNFQMQLINSYRRLNIEGIDQLVNIEMQRLRMHYANEEDRYVEQMLRDNPVVVERRQCNTPRGSSTYSSSTEDIAPTNSPHHHLSSSTTTEIGAGKLLQQQRAESCRKSRINNKIKKAKTKFRHKFISLKLTQSAHTLDCIRGVIAQAEAQLLCNGHQLVTLQQLRRTFGIDRRIESEVSSHSPTSESSLSSAASPSSSSSPLSTTMASCQSPVPEGRYIGFQSRLMHQQQ